MLESSIRKIQGKYERDNSYKNKKKEPTYKKTIHDKLVFENNFNEEIYQCLLKQKCHLLKHNISTNSSGSYEDTV